MTPPAPFASQLVVRVNYSEVDPMGVAYHARYIPWLDMARTEHLRQSGMSYRELEARGFFLAVTDLRVRYREPARYDDLVRVHAWPREVESRRVTFGYLLEHAERGTRLATALVTLVSLDRDFRPVRLPEDVRAILRPLPDPWPLDL